MSRIIKRGRPPLTLPEYERIFRIIHGLLLNEKCEPSKACTYFAVIGTFVLRKHHRLPANPLAGIAAYNFGLVGNQVLAFGRDANGMLASDDKAFHFWIEVDDWVIDFQAPIFEATKAQPKMFQKKTISIVADQEQIHETGSFFHEADPMLTSQLLKHFTSHPMNDDLATICANWYRPPPKKIMSSIQISNQKGEISEVRLSPITLVGAW